jgi:hypothetical protein
MARPFFLGPRYDVAVPNMGDTDCELIRDGLWAQPTNAASSLAYILVALLILIWAIRNQRVSRSLIGYTTVLAIVGLGSVDFHGTQSTLAQFLHDVPVAVLLLGSVLIPVIRKIKGEPATPGMSWGWLLLLVTSGLLAVVAFLLGGTSSTFCDPQAIVQLHGLWHVLTAVVFGSWAMILYGDGNRASERSRSA